jgi:hypothetical protein
MADAPHLTIHALSMTAPVQHKVDVTLRLAHCGTGAPVVLCTHCTRPFLPTRARSSGALQWTALLLAGDKPAPPSARGGGKGTKSYAGAANAGGARFELACPVPEAGVPLHMTVHPSTSIAISGIHRSLGWAFHLATVAGKGSHAHWHLHRLFSPSFQRMRSIPHAALCPCHQLSRSRRTTHDRRARCTSRGHHPFPWRARDLALVFDAGILTDARPFWAPVDIARGEAGVRVRTATGKTCSVVLTRCPPSSEKNKNPEEEGEGTEFSCRSHFLRLWLAATRYRAYRLARHIP